MGQPPQHLITRRLIKQFFKIHEGGRQDKAQESYINELMKCWQEHGYNSMICREKSLELSEKFMDIGKTSKLTIEDKSLSDYVISTLNPPIYRHQQKGKYKDYYTGIKPRVNSIYDGIFKIKDPKR